MSYELVGMIANVSLALSLIVALVFGLIEVRAASRERRERLTLEALNIFQSREFATPRKPFYEAREGAKS